MVLVGWSDTIYLQDQAGKCVRVYVCQYTSIIIIIIIMKEMNTIIL